ncbi:PaaI family thioesterase [Pseudomonas fluorescens]|uniref:PaaI family thioesterase n=1 Tax=Pseudomonas fluorescens TaxID=294 RepID=UPI0035238629
MIESLREHLQQAHNDGDYAALLQLIPYARLIGVECSRVGDELLFRLPANKDNIGNPLLPAIHGGVIAGFMELAAALHLLILTGAPQVPKIIDFSLDYLRAGQFRDTWARCQVCRQGRRVANVAVTAWQTTEADPIATARAHFKVDEPLKS